MRIAFSVKCFEDRVVGLHQIYKYNSGSALKGGGGGGAGGHIVCRIYNYAQYRV